jgi:hypothetical protein
MSRNPCCICGAWPVHVAHVGPRGYGQKCSDLETLPLCEEHHIHGHPESHHTLQKKFQEFHGISFIELWAQYRAAYLAGEEVLCVAAQGREAVRSKSDRLSPSSLPSPDFLEVYPGDTDYYECG